MSAMEESPVSEGAPLPELAPLARRIAPYVAALAIGAAGFGYALHERHDARLMTAENQQMTAELSATHSQLTALAAKVTALSASAQAAQAAAKPSPAVPLTKHAALRRASRHRADVEDLRFKKLQSQVDAQGREIDQTRADLSSAQTQLSGSIARTHDELVALEKKGERRYFEFDLVKSKQFRREGPLSVSLRKANEKHQYADLNLIVDDRTVTQKHVNLDQPVQFYEPGTQQPVEVVVNQISRNHIHGYVSAPRYAAADLAASNPADTPPTGADQAATSDSKPTLRQRLHLPNLP